MVTHGTDASFEYAVQEIGCQAVPLLDRPGVGSVSALFDSSFYIEIEGGLVCLGHTEMHTSSLNLVTDVPASVHWSASGLRTGDPVWISADRLRVGNRFVFSTDTATQWSPNPIPTTWTTASLKAGLDLASEIGECLAPNEGLARFIQTPRPQFDRLTVCAYAASPIDGFYHWLSNMHPGPNWPPGLLGLGPGLTPSGDDFIGGMMIAFHVIGNGRTAEKIWRVVKPHAANMTNAISCAHLQSAAEGYGSAALHHALAAILCGRKKDIRLAMIGAAAIGHTSGWDALAGAVVACHAWQAWQPV